MKKDSNWAPWTERQFYQNEAGQYVIDLTRQVAGERVRVYRVLGPSRRAAIRDAKELVKAATGGDKKTADKSRNRGASVATIGQIEDAYLAGTFDVKKTGRRQNIGYFRRIVKTGLGKPADWAEDKIRALPASILTDELAVKFKANAKETWLPRAPRPHEAAGKVVPGHLIGSAKVAVWSNINRHLNLGRNLFTDDRLDAVEGCFQGLKMPDLEGFLAIKGVKNFKKAKDYIPPEDREIDLVVKMMLSLRDDKLRDENGERLKWKKGKKWHTLNGARAYVMLVIAFATGMRKVEIANLRWDMLKMIDGVWYFVLEPTATWEGTKAAEVREVPVDAHIITELQKHRQRLHETWAALVKKIKAAHPARVAAALRNGHPEPALRLPDDPMKSEFIIPGTKTGREDYAPRECAVAMRSAGWDREQCLHELRKVWASDLASTPDPDTGQVPQVSEIMDVAGWKDWHTARRYMKRNRKSKIAVNKRLGGLSGDDVDLLDQRKIG